MLVPSRFGIRDAGAGIGGHAVSKWGHEMLYHGAAPVEFAAWANVRD